MTWQRIARGLSTILFVIAVAMIGYVVKTEIDARRFQVNERRRLEQERAQLREESRRSAPSGGAVVERRPPRPRTFKDGEAIGEIRIARLKLSVVVAEGDSPTILRRAAGHLTGTAQPGSEGNVVIAGHRDTFFRPLKDIRAGDTIVVETPDGDFRYLVESTAIVSPTTVSVLAPTAERTLTLITCFPFYYVGSAPDRFIVRARELPNPPGGS
jgi:sortase A